MDRQTCSPRSHGCGYRSHSYMHLMSTPQTCTTVELSRGRGLYLAALGQVLDVAVTTMFTARNGSGSFLCGLLKLRGALLYVAQQCSFWLRQVSCKANLAVSTVKRTRLSSIILFGVNAKHQTAHLDVVQKCAIG